MISLSPRPRSRSWKTISFPSTLHLEPILNLLLAEVPSCCQWDLRLGLQEALVNAAKHGNQLDPSKVICIRFARIQSRCWWIITDQGNSFIPPPCSLAALPDSEEEQDCGRGFFLMEHIFDQVRWNPGNNELTLCKEVQSLSPLGLIPLFSRAS